MPIFGLGMPHLWPHMRLDNTVEMSGSCFFHRPRAARPAHVMARLDRDRTTMNKQQLARPATRDEKKALFIIF